MKISKSPVFHDPSMKRKRWIHGISITIIIFSIFLGALTRVHFLLEPDIPNPGLLDDHYHSFQQTGDTLGSYGINKTHYSGSNLTVYAYHVEWDPNSFASLQQHINKIDIVVPEWLRLTEQGIVEIDSDMTYRTLEWLKDNDESIAVYPHIVNYDISYGGRNGGLVTSFLQDNQKTNQLVAGLVRYISVRQLDGVSIDFENLDQETWQLMPEFLQRLRDELDRVYPSGEIIVHLPYNKSYVPYADLYEAPGLSVLMAYDQHRSGGQPGPVAGVDWYQEGLQSLLTGSFTGEIIVGLGNYGYDRGQSGSAIISRQSAVTLSEKSSDGIIYASGSYNPTFLYLSGHDQRTVWYLDSVVTQKQTAIASALGVTNIALRRLGSEDPRVREVLSNFTGDEKTDPLVTTHGSGPLMKIVENNGAYDVYRFPIPDRNKLLITFDDGPSKYTPEILDILEKYDVPAVFFPVGHQISKFPKQIQRIFREGHVVGNHSYQHKRIQEITNENFEKDFLRVHKNIESLTFHTPFLYRPPEGLVYYDPDNVNEMENLLSLGSIGYYLLDIEIDPRDREGHSAEEIVASIHEQVENGNIILLHDGGGAREETVKALPMIIGSLRAKGYEFVSLQDIYDDAYTLTMQPLSGFYKALSTISNVWVFLSEDVLAVARFLLTIVIVFSLFHLAMILMLFIMNAINRKKQLDETFQPRVSVIVPAYNEGVVILKTINNILSSTYRNFNVVFVNDGSSDDTLKLVQQVYADHPMVTLLTKENGGKASALNMGIQHADGEIVVIQDADTLFEKDALKYIVDRFRDPDVGGVSGYVKVGNTESRLGRYQAIEYISSQGVNRRAADMINCILVVPGAIGARRKSIIEEVGYIKHDTLTEDCDLTVEVLRAGHRIVYEDRAIARTEAPESVKSFVKQRFRWFFGMMQVGWKHVNALFSFRNPWLGWFSLPQLFIGTFVFPVISPLLDFLGLFVFITVLGQFVLGNVQVFSATAGAVIVYFFLYLFLDVIITVLAFALDKRKKWSWLLLVPFQRIVYRFLYYRIGLKSVYVALIGHAPGRNKLKRTGTVDDAEMG